jgi:hypothetical protein
MFLASRFCAFVTSMPPLVVVCCPGLFPCPSFLPGVLAPAMPAPIGSIPSHKGGVDSANISSTVTASPSCGVLSSLPPGGICTVGPPEYGPTTPGTAIKPPEAVVIPHSLVAVL